MKLIDVWLVGVVEGDSLSVTTGGVPPTVTLALAVTARWVTPVS